MGYLSKGKVADLIFSLSPRRERKDLIFSLSPCAPARVACTRAPALLPHPDPPAAAAAPPWLSGWSSRLAPGGSGIDSRRALAGN